jgi:RND family efflux transporter MFP subunit
MNKAVPLIALGLSLAACSESEAPAKPKGGGGPPPALVELGEVGSEDVTDRWSFLGRVQPALSADIAAAVSGHVLEVTAREGDQVQKGQKLVRLDSRDVSARMNAARAVLKGIVTELTLAEKQNERIAKLGFPTVSEPEKERYQQAVDVLRAKKATQEAELRGIQVTLADHVIKAPFSGAVGNRQVDPGAWVNVGQPVMSLVSTLDTEVLVDVSAELGTRLALEQIATLRGRGEVTAAIAGIVPTIDETTGTMRIRLIPTERPPWLISGMPIDVEFEVTFGGAGAVTVHPDALVKGATGVRVVKFVAGKGVSVPVEVVASTRTMALVRGEGLAVGDKVVVRGNERLRPGQPLEVKD